VTVIEEVSDLLSREQVESWFWGVVNENKRLRERLERVEGALAGAVRCLETFEEVNEEFLDECRALLEPRAEG